MKRWGMWEGRREGEKNERHGVYIIMIFILMISLSRG
jgi:hypothetical protein